MAQSSLKLWILGGITFAILAQYFTLFAVGFGFCLYKIALKLVRGGDNGTKGE
jgi:hypothetical protein